MARKGRKVRQAKERALQALVDSGEVVHCLCGDKFWLAQFAPSVDPRCKDCEGYEAADPDGPSIQALLEQELRK